MCIGDIIDENHSCANVCPVCFIFYPINALKLLSGEKVNLGIVDLFVQIAEEGCRMCQVLVEVWELNDEIFQSGAKVSVRRQEDAPAGFLWALLFEISQPLDFDWMTNGTGRIRDKKFKSWAVPLGIYSKGSAFLDDFITMRPPNPVVCRDEVFDAFKVELETCLSSHEDCPKPDTSILPTRLLLLDNSTPERVSLHETTPGERGSYVALSYCWGTAAQFRLLQANIEDLKEGIELDALPRTIMDSIIATRKLGIKYLWVDSLCIIQDSKDDKDKEIVKMASIYKNATITISAAAATDCAQGFLEDRADVQLRLDKSICLPFFNSDDRTLEDFGVIDWIYICPDPHMGHKIKRFSEEAINTRAWTYQESTLAPRLVIFGSGPPQWHCKGRWKISGLNIPPSMLPVEECTSDTMKMTVEDGRLSADQTLRIFERPIPPKDDIGLWLNWFPVLENYSRRALSFPTDKLLALSALAAEHQSAQTGVYAAGLWEASLPRSLLWRRSSSPDEMADHVNQRTPIPGWLRSRLFHLPSSSEMPEASTWSGVYIAPTWSPMSSSAPIEFEKFASQEEDEFHISLVTIHEIHRDPSNKLNQFGSLDFAYLDLTAPMRSISWQELTANFVIMGWGEPFVYSDFIIPDDPAFFQEMCAKYEPSSNPQHLADTDTQHVLDEGDASIFVGDGGLRIRMPVTPEPASRRCRSSHTGMPFRHSIPFMSGPNVRQTIFKAMSQDISTTDSSRRKKDPADIAKEECEFWLLEVERSMSPAGLVLKRVQGDVFARVGYFGMNRSLDPEIVCLPGLVQVRGRTTFNFGQPDKKDTWNDGLSKRRIYLV